MPSTLHCMARLFNRWELLSILLDNPVVTVAIYGCGTVNHSSRTSAGNILLYLQLFCLVHGSTLTNITLLKLPTCSMYYRQHSIFTKGSTLNHSFNQCGITSSSNFRQHVNFLLYIGGDGRADSPGYSAKYVSLTYI